MRDIASFGKLSTVDNMASLMRCRRACSIGSSESSVTSKRPLTRPRMVHLFEPSEIRRLSDNSSSTLRQLARVVECDLAVHSCLTQAVRSIDCRVPDGSAPNDNGPHMIRSVSYTHLTLPTKRIV